ncbi:LysR family transcriptional regulator [Pseudomonas cichorii]|uniref:LysR family transcriptional regulator n=1 Tax=Pseudomonas cichorii TaxID=36746 RepID=A0A3M4VG09_PSECI|nr:LysR family transcriptional regulator [Pseudomonas cichorii]RMR50553.1 LysR family transcriptional regulator [Pseudomonas cichorii]GFM74523.1 LysR family transcriptional regulator [Pseudomonas cichorii]
MELLQSMQVFARLAELGSFTRAADAMQIGRPQVTRAIQELETSLGVRLFQRTTRTVRLTSEGERFYERVKDILGDVAEATAMFALPGSTLRGRLRVDIPTAFSQPGLIESLLNFTTLYPAIELALGVTDRTVDLVAEGVDCVLRIGELPSSSLVARRIGLATMITCAAPRYLEQHGEPKTLDDLDAHRGVTFLSGHNQRPLPWQFLHAGSEQTYVSRHGITVNESNAYVECGVAGFGILQAPGITLDRFLANGSLVEVLRPYRPHPRPVSVLYPSRSHLAPQIHVFVDWVREQFPIVYGRWLEN